MLRFGMDMCMCIGGGDAQFTNIDVMGRGLGAAFSIGVAAFSLDAVCGLEGMHADSERGLIECMCM